VDSHSKNRSLFTSHFSPVTSFTMITITLPYGRTTLSATMAKSYQADLITLAPQPAVADPIGAVTAALDNLLGDAAWGDFAGARSAAIAINDKTRRCPTTTCCHRCCASWKTWGYRRLPSA
jgi:hypothetical protein